MNEKQDNEIAEADRLAALKRAGGQCELMGYSFIDDRGTEQADADIARLDARDNDPVKTYDRWRCGCSAPDNLVVCHIRTPEAGGNNHLLNLQVLCKEHYQNMIRYIELETLAGYQDCDEEYRSWRVRFSTWLHRESLLKHGKANTEPAHSWPYARSRPRTLTAAEYQKEQAEWQAHIDNMTDEKGTAH